MKQKLFRKENELFFPLPHISFCGKKFYVTEELSFPLVFSYLGHLKLEWPQLKVWCPWSSPSPHAPWNRRLLLCAVDGTGNIWHLMCH